MLSVALSLLFRSISFNAVNRPTHRGVSHTPFLVFAGIVGLSVVFFFIFSAGSLRRTPKPVATPGGPKPAEISPPAAPSVIPAVPVVPVVAPAPASKTTAGIPQAKSKSYSTAEALLSALAARIDAGDQDAVAKIAGSGPRTAFLMRLSTECGWRVSPEAPWKDAGAMSAVSRYELNLKSSSASQPAPAGPVVVDIERTQTEGWKVKALRFDPALVAQVNSMAVSAGTVSDAAVLTDAPDPLDQARRFLSSVLSHDFKAARGFTDPAGVTHERLAGICIVFEEGEYRIAEKRPVVVTAGTNESAWAIVKIRSDKQNLDSEVGLEMARSPGGEWRIHALDFNRMLESYVQASGAGKVFYSPLVKSAKGGESIVVYFEFDRAELHARALHQMDIIASLLKSDPARKMRITGHTDALGSDDYNARLSAARARNVHARLLELGVAAEQIETIGFGSKEPLDPNRLADGKDNPEGRSRNRRTEIYLDF